MCWCHMHHPTCYPLLLIIAISKHIWYSTMGLQVIHPCSLSAVLCDLLLFSSKLIGRVICIRNPYCLSFLLLQQLLSNLHYLHPKKISFLKARNELIAKPKGQILIFISVDLWATGLSVPSLQHFLHLASGYYSLHSSSSLAFSFWSCCYLLCSYLPVTKYCNIPGCNPGKSFSFCLHSNFTRSHPTQWLSISSTHRSISSLCMQSSLSLTSRPLFPVACLASSPRYLTHISKGLTCS